MSDVLAGEELTVDALTADWTIVQRRRGHRHSTDDLLTGWYAVEKAAAPRTLLDLGAGIGSVGLLALSAHEEARLTAVEAQATSYALLLRNIADNGLEGRVRAIHGDLRHVDLGGERFDLVTGSPPYFDVRAGVVPADSQKAHARFELRGDVRDYCLRAYASMNPKALFVFCFPSPQRDRARAAVSAAGLAVESMRDVVPRIGAEPLFSLFACRRREDFEGAPSVEAPHVVRDADGVPTEMHAAARRVFGFR